MEETENIVEIHKENFKIYDTLENYLIAIRQKKQQHSVIVHLNICSMRKNWEQLRDMLINEIIDIDVVVITEINIKESENILYNLNGYKLVVYNRENKTRGGGIGMYIKENIEISNITMGNSKGEAYEYIQLTVQIDNKNTTIVAIYRPPDRDVNVFVEDMQHRLLEIKEKANVIIIGDMNIDLNDINGTKVNKYVNAMAKSGMENCIFSNTREVIRDNKLVVGCIDHIYERFHMEVFSAVIQMHVSDHYMVAIGFLTSSHNKNKTQKILRYNENNVEKTLLNIKWDNEIETSDTIEIYDTICSKFNKIYNSNRTTKCKPEKIRMNKCWVTNEIIEQIKIRDKAFKKWKSSPSNINYRETYKNLRNKINKEIKIQKNNFHMNRIENYKDDMKKIWKEINSIIGRTVAGNIDDTINKFLGKMFRTEQILAAFVDEFSTGIESVIHKCQRSVIDEGKIDKESRSNVSLYIPAINEVNVVNIISNMKNNKSPGIDGIRIQDLKLCKRQMAPILVKLINASIKNGILPRGLKTSIIRPIYKGGSHTDYKNYRPIAILPSIEKIIEVYISTKLSKYLETHKVINEYQHGFQRGKSTVSLLENFTDYINGKLNTNKIVITIFIDLKKAFDTINHTILIKRLENIGVRGYTLDWFKNYLKQRKMTVMINKTNSETK